MNNIDILPIMLTIQELGDLELAVLLSLVAQQHCIITTDTTFLPKLAQELRLVSNNFRSPYPCSLLILFRSQQECSLSLAS